MIQHLKKIEIPVVLKGIAILVLLCASPFAGSTQEGLVINEFMLSNSDAFSASDDEYPDWLELYNGSNEDVNLQGYGLSDNYDDPFKWVFPDVSIPQGDYMVVFASGEDEFEYGSFHTNFKLSSSGEEILLTKPNGLPVDEIEPVSVGENISYGRYPDGSEHMERLFAHSAGDSNNETNGIHFSHEPGFFASAIELILSPSGNQDIRFTTDGSDPSFDSPLYTTPIVLDELVNAPNVYSDILTSPSWESPIDPVYKCHIIRAALFDGDEIDSDIYHKTYFIDPDTFERFEGYNGLSIISDPDNLFSAETGIYVPGDFFETSNTTWTGNYFQKGIEWERDGNFQYFSAQGELLVDQNVGLRIHGGKGRNLPQKSLRIYARDEYGAPRVNRELFDFKDSRIFRRLVVRNSLSGWQNTVIKDECTAYICRDLEFEVLASQPVVVFLNGEYWGIQSIREYFDDNYVSEEFELEEDSINIVLHGSGGRPDVPIDWGIVHGTNADHIALYDFLNNNELEDPVNYDYIAGKLNIPSIIDYYCAEIYFNNADWPTNNNKLWQNGIDGKWSQLFFDLDGGWSYLGTSFNALHRALSDNGIAQAAPYATFLLRKLIEAPEFQEAFLARMACLMNDEFTEDTLTEAVELYKAKYFDGMPEHIERWGDPVSMSAWENKVQTMVVFSAYRKGYMIDHINAEFNIDFIPDDYECPEEVDPPVDPDYGPESALEGEDDPLDISEIAAMDQHVFLYPNPSTTNSIWLDFDLETARVAYEIYDLTGKRLSNGSASHHDQIALPFDAGTYVVRILHGYTHTTKTIIVQ